MEKVKEAGPDKGAAEVLIQNSKRGQILAFVQNKPILAAALSGLLVSLSFAGFSQFYLVFFGLVGLLGAVLSAASPKAAAKAGFVYGFVLSLIHHHWMLFVRMPAPIGWALTAGIIGGFFAFWAWISRGPGKGHPVVAILAYGCLEQLVNLGPFSFGWYTLGYTQWNNPYFLESTALIGAHGLSLLLLAGNFCLWSWLKSGQPKWGLGALAGLVVLLLLPQQINNSLKGMDAGLQFWSQMGNFYKAAKTGRGTPPPMAPRQDVALVVVQINVSNDEKEHPSQTEKIVRAHLKEAKKGIRKVPEGVDTLVVFPETFVAAYLEDDPTNQHLWQALKDFAIQENVWLAMGLNDVEFRHGKQLDRNAFALLNPEGKLVGRYFKRNLVPFGEYVPYRFLIDKIPPLGQWVRDNVFPYDNVPGEKLVLFKGPGGRTFFSPICFETSFPWMFRQAAQKGATWVLTPTNDAWFGKSFLAVQHMAQGVVRGKESGLTIVQASNSGISYATSEGQILWQTGVMEKQTVVKPLLTFHESLFNSPIGSNSRQGSGIPALPTVLNHTVYTLIGGYLEALVFIFTLISLLWITFKPATIRK